MPPDYVHGYAPRENARLQDQADTLADLLHHDTRYRPGETVLEVGCGVGSQTVTLAEHNPDTEFVSVDISAESISKARAQASERGLTNVQFLQADIFASDLPINGFDHAFVCFVLEHLEDPSGALAICRRLVRPGGTLTVIEGDHGSTYFYPTSTHALKAIACQIELQQQGGGNALIGRELYPLLTSAGLSDVTVTPRVVYVDGSKPQLANGFTRRTFAAMIEGIREAAIEAKLMEPADFDEGVRDLYRASEPDGVFCYTFFKATGINP